ncbi:hypothetical protein [Rhodococcus sp. NPDC060176]|uniref:hypothetical protein n=1 Tax=Rhodococcus sp. NPDC060176 TaxID=3347062 RepID=UPI003653CC66
MRTPPAQHRAWAARAALITTRNSQGEMDLLVQQVGQHEDGFSDLIMALAYELGNMFVATGNLDALASYAEQVQAEALANGA